MSGFDRQEMNTLLAATPLQRSQTRQLFERLIAGQVEDVQLAAAIAAMKVRGETADELVGAAEALLAAAVPFPGAPCDSIDIVGTGGDGLNTINISTLAAIVTAASGYPVTKHGNRSITSASGSFDLVEQLGIDLHQSPADASKLLREFGLCFLFAPDYHSGLRHATNVRKLLNSRTIFNLLGPLANPARPKRILLGVSRPEFLMPMSEAARRLGFESAAIVHGSGTDEVAIHDSTKVHWIRNGNLEESNLSPSDFGFPHFPMHSVICDNGQSSRERAIRVLEGKGSDAENAAVAANVAVAIALFGPSDLKSNAATAIDALKSGRATKLIRSMTHRATA